MTSALAPEHDRWADLPPLTGSPLLDPWRIRVRRVRAGLVEARPSFGPTAAERAMWEALQSLDQGWRREYSTGRYRLDFYLESAQQAVEIDGSSHWGAVAALSDAQRDDWHKARGIDTLRLSNDQVLSDVRGVLEIICRAVSLRPLGGLPISEPPGELPVRPSAVECEPLEIAETKAEAAIEAFARQACITVLPAQSPRVGFRGWLRQNVR